MKTKPAKPEKIKDIVFDAFGHSSVRKSCDFLRSFHLEIYAVGPDVETALKSLSTALGWGGVGRIDFERDEKLCPCEWYVRFYTSSGTSMKAAGEYVTGGVIVTWWK